MKKFLTIAMAAAGLWAVPASAATLVLNDDGRLTGAVGVDIGGSLFDVEFVDGTCAEVFGVCATSSFTFQTQAGALAAANALGDQVLLNGMLGNFDTDLTATIGCDATNTNCRFIVPYSVQAVGNIQQLNNVSFLNRPGLDAIVTTPLGANVSTNGESVFARFSPAVVVPGAVPEPSTWLMMLLGFGAIGATLRRRKTRTSLRFDLGKASINVAR